MPELKAHTNRNLLIKQSSTYIFMFNFLIKINLAACRKPDDFVVFSLAVVLTNAR